MNNNLFRNKTLKKISSPEQINDYIKTSNPSIYIILSAVVILIVGALIWAVFGELELVVTSVTVCESKEAYCYISENDMEKIGANTYVRINSTEYKLGEKSSLPILASEIISPYGLHIGGIGDDEWVYAVQIEAMLDDGLYSTDIVIESVSPISLLMN